MPSASGDRRRTRLALSPRSIGLIMLTVAAVSILIGTVRASVRVIGWMAAAAAIASLLEPLVSLLARRMRRGVALVLTVLAVLGVAGGITFFTVSDVVHEVHVLQRSAPERARQLEHSKRFGSAARSFHLERRTRQAVKEIPERLRGGSSADAIRAAGTRGVAYLATTVLTIFLIINGRRLINAGIDQIPDEKRRQRLRIIVRHGGTMGVQYTTGSLAMSALAGVLIGGTAYLVHVPGAIPLGLWAALWDLVPLIGAVVGALPVALLAAAASPTTGVAIFALFIAYEAVEAFVFQQQLEERSVHIGAFLTLLAGSVGLELYGIGGALFALFATSVAVGMFEAWRADET
jgi:predicted PurR-regulated permease PerM